MGGRKDTVLDIRRPKGHRRYKENKGRIAFSKKHQPSFPQHTQMLQSLQMLMVMLKSIFRRACISLLEINSCAALLKDLLPMTKF